jgi:hypothetical protein
LNCQNRKLWF